MGRRRSMGYHGDFESLKFPKSGKEIIEKATSLQDELLGMVATREKRIREAAEEAGMKTGADVLFNIEEIDYGMSNTDGGLTAGLAGKIKKEVSARQREKAEAEKLTMIIENLPSDDTFTLTFSELGYFGF